MASAGMNFLDESRGKGTRGMIMDAADIESKLNELVNEINTTPTPQTESLITLVKQTDSLHKQLKKSVDGLQDSLDFLRIVIKYQLFDLEATRRENEHLRKLLEDKGS